MRLNPWTYLEKSKFSFKIWISDRNYNFKPYKSIHQEDSAIYPYFFLKYKKKPFTQKCIIPTYFQPQYKKWFNYCTFSNRSGLFFFSISSVAQLQVTLLKKIRSALPQSLGELLVPSLRVGRQTVQALGFLRIVVEDRYSFNDIQLADCSQPFCYLEGIFLRTKNI